MDKGRMWSGVTMFFRCKISDTELILAIIGNAFSRIRPLKGALYP